MEVKLNSKLRGVCFFGIFLKEIWFMNLDSLFLFFYFDMTYL